MYYRARWYDPQVGRFISEDPIGFRGRDVNFYGYVHNDPLRLIDPTGLRRCHPIVGAIIGGLLGAGGGGVVGGVLGAVAGGTIGGAGGTLVVPGVGTIAGAGSGVVVGAGAGAFGGSAIGAGVGIGAGINYCNGDDTCDSSPRVNPLPPPPPPGQPDGEGTCRRLLELCVSNPWQPGWNSKQFGPRKDCGGCFRQCKNDGGAWPFDRCPIFHN